MALTKPVTESKFSLTGMPSAVGHFIFPVQYKNREFTGQLS